MIKEKGDEIIGKQVRVKACEAREHGDNDGCVCHLKGKIVTIDRRYKQIFAGTPSYHIRGMEHRVRRSEVTLLRSVISS